jgi:hypothetical protein
MMMVVMIWEPAYPLVASLGPSVDRCVGKDTLRSLSGFVPGMGDLWWTQDEGKLANKLERCRLPWETTPATRHAVLCSCIHL